MSLPNLFTVKSVLFNAWRSNEKWAVFLKCPFIMMGCTSIHLNNHLFFHRDAKNKKNGAYLASNQCSAVWEVIYQVLGGSRFEIRSLKNFMIFLYSCYYPHTSRDSVSTLCGNFSIWPIRNKSKSIEGI